LLAETWVVEYVKMTPVPFSTGYLTEFGCDAAAIADLRERGIVA
jgi:hypothetical protein